MRSFINLSKLYVRLNKWCPNTLYTTTQTPHNRHEYEDVMTTQWARSGSQKRSNVPVCGSHERFVLAIEQNDRPTVAARCRIAIVPGNWHCLRECIFLDGFVCCALVIESHSVPSWSICMPAQCKHRANALPLRAPNGDEQRSRNWFVSRAMFFCWCLLIITRCFPCDSSRLMLIICDSPAGRWWRFVAFRCGWTCTGTFQLRFYFYFYVSSSWLKFKPRRWKITL